MGKTNRLVKIIREMISVGADGFTGSSAAEGPTAGYDPLMKAKPEKRKKDYLNRYIDQLKKEYRKKK
jgi:hypothetical protein